MDRGAWRATVHAITESDTTEQLTHTGENIILRFSSASSRKSEQGYHPNPTWNLVHREQIHSTYLRVFLVTLSGGPWASDKLIHRLESRQTDSHVRAQESMVPVSDSHMEKAVSSPSWTHPALIIWLLSPFAAAHVSSSFQNHQPGPALGYHTTVGNVSLESVWPHHPSHPQIFMPAKSISWWLILQEDLPVISSLFHWFKMWKTAHVLENAKNNAICLGSI